MIPPQQPNCCSFLKREMLLLTLIHCEDSMNEFITDRLQSHHPSFMKGVDSGDFKHGLF